MAEVGDLGDGISVNVEMGKGFFPNFLHFFHKNVGRRGCNDESQYLKSLTENDGPHRRRWFALWSTL